MTVDKNVNARGLTSRRGLHALVATLILPCALAACSSTPAPSPSDTATQTQTSTASPSPSDTSTPSPSPTDTASPTPTDTASPSDSPSPTGSTSPTGTASPSASPSTSGSVSPSPSGSVLGIGVVYSPTTAAAWEQINIVGATDRSLAGKRAYIVRVNGGMQTVLDTGAPVNASGSIRTWAKLGRNGDLQLIVPAGALAAGPIPAGTVLLAQSGVFSVTIG